MSKPGPHPGVVMMRKRAAKARRPAKLTRCADCSALFAQYYANAHAVRCPDCTRALRRRQGKQ